MAVSQQARVLSALNTEVEFGPYVETGASSGEANLEKLDGLIGTDAVSFTEIEGYSEGKKDLTGNKVYVRNSNYAPTMTINLMVTSAGAKYMRQQVQDQENPDHPTTLFQCVVAAESNEDLILEGGRIRTWPPFHGFGDGELGDLQYMIEFSSYHIQPRN